MSKLHDHFIEELMEELMEDQLESVFVDEHLVDHSDHLELMEMFLNHNERPKQNRSL